MAKQEHTQFLGTAFNFDFYNAGWDATTLRKVIEQTLAELASVVRRFQRMPTLDELKIYRQTFPAPTPNALWRAFGPVPAVIARLLAWAQARAEYADVAQMLTREPTSACPP